jgi:hypothetical protein
LSAYLSTRAGTADTERDESVVAVVLRNASNTKLVAHFGGTLTSGHQADLTALHARSCRYVRARTARDSHMRDDYRGRRTSYLRDAVSRDVRWTMKGMPYEDHQSG